ncbi:MAG: undecaprenyl-phosphate galactose phosphotransferase WbaP, partial [Cyanobacteria bacterium J06632_22]
MTPYPSIKAAQRSEIAPLKVRSSPWFMVAALVMADTLALTIAGVTSVWVRLSLNGQFDPMVYWRLWPLIGLFLLTYALLGLYPGIAISPVEELRRVVLITSLLYLSLGSAIFLF